jgi:signal transduction histidine kinase/ActR/RegA family two-component response regulator
VVESNVPCSRRGIFADLAGVSRLISPLLAAFVVIGASIVAWHSVPSRGDGQEPGRTYAIWRAGQAVDSYIQLRQAIASGLDPGRAEEIRTLADNFNQAVARLHDPAQAAAIEADSAVNDLVRQLDTDRKQLPAALRPLDDPGVVPAEQPLPPDDSVELARLTEAVNHASATSARHDGGAAYRLRWVLSGLAAALAATTLLLLAILVRKLGELRVTRHKVDATRLRLRKAREAAGRAEAAKSNFIATASHVMRAPIDTVLNLTDSLLEERLPPAQRELTGEIRDAGANVLRVLDDVLDFTSLRSGDLTLNERPFSPEALTSAAVTRIAVQARAKGLTIVATPAPGLPKVLLGDPDRIERILFRLAANAVKSTEKGGISLQVLCVQRTAELATIEWVVTDTGVGIDPTRLDRLFGHGAETEQGRTCLGLAMCRRLVTRMGGCITVESVMGQGSRFRVRLPLRALPAGADRVNATPPPPSAAPLREKLRALGRPPRFLLAEDTPAGQFILRQFLAREGIAPDMVADGRSAVMAAEADRYDVICMDLRMPEMDGFEAARRIRSGPGPSARTPIIAVTGSTSETDIQACKDAGMTLFVAKPVRREILLNALLTALSNPNRGADPIPAPDLPNPPLQAAARIRGEMTETPDI